MSLTTQVIKDKIYVIWLSDTNPNDGGHLGKVMKLGWPFIGNVKDAIPAFKKTSVYGGYLKYNKA